MTIDTARLLELAEKASPGPWGISESEVVGIVQKWADDSGIHYGQDIVEAIGVAYVAFEDGEERNEQVFRDAEFIAACDPTTVIALLDNMAAMKLRISILENTLTMARHEVVSLGASEADEDSIVHDIDKALKGGP